MAKAKLLLQEIETYAQNIGDTIRDPLLILDRELRVKSANRSFYRTFQATPEETEGQYIYKLGNGQWNIPVLLDMLKEIVPKKLHFDDFEVEHEFPMIGCRAMLLNARKLYRPGNRTVLLALAIEDVTERRRAEEALAAVHRRDSRIAAALQRSLLFTPPEDAFPGLAVRTFYEAAGDEAAVGGDFWDAFAFDSRKVAFVIGDVMGKGLNAAVFTTELRYTLRGFVREHEKPARILKQMNSYLCESHRLYREGLNSEDDDAPVCLALATVDTASGQALVSCAGMAGPLLIRQGGQIEEVNVTGLPLGIYPDVLHDEITLQLDSGDTLLHTTDGITDARRGREFLDPAGLKRLVRAGLSAGTLEALGRTILDGARDFANGRLQDDACLLMARRS